MFVRYESADGQGFWRSSLLDRVGVPHVFSTRAWDVKTAADVRIVARAAGVFDASAVFDVVLTKQVHGKAVTQPGAALAEADAHVTDDPRAVVAVRTADCVPVLMSMAEGGAVAAVHAGWRGLDPEVNVIAAAAAALRRVAGVSSDAPLVAAVGPCVGVAHYEVGPEVAARFRERYPQAVRDDLAAKAHLNTRAVAVAQLIEAGLVEGDGASGGKPGSETGKIDVFPGCTFGDAEAFFSYRRDGRGVGHLVAIAAPKRC